MPKKKLSEEVVKARISKRLTTRRSALRSLALDIAINVIRHCKRQGVTRACENLKYYELLKMCDEWYEENKDNYDWNDG